MSVGLYVQKEKRCSSLTLSIADTVAEGPIHDKILPETKNKEKRDDAKEGDKEGNILLFIHVSLFLALFLPPLRMRSVAPRLCYLSTTALKEASFHDDLSLEVTETFLHKSRAGSFCTN